MLQLNSGYIAQDIVSFQIWSLMPNSLNSTAHLTSCPSSFAKRTSAAALATVWELSIATILVSIRQSKSIFRANTMATKSPQIPLAEQPPVHHFPRQHQYPHGHNLPLGDHPYGPGPINGTNYTVNPYVRIAVLEKELEHCQTGKAEGEIAAQYLSSLNAKGATNGPSGDVEATKLRQLLAQAEKEKKALEARLENAWAIISTVLTSKAITSALNLVSKSDECKPSRASGVQVQDEDLIDLVGAPIAFDSSSTSGNDATLLNRSYEDSLEDNDEAQGLAQAKLLPVSELTDGEREPYIHHFLSKVHDAPSRGDGLVRTAFQVPKHDARGSKYSMNSNASLDRRSETSVEPKTDVSSYECSIPSGPVSTSTSFVTANTQFDQVQDSSADCVATANKAVEAQPLEVRRWNVSASTTSFEGVEASTSALHFKDKIWSSKNNRKPSVTKSSQGPISDKPSWQVCKLFSSEEQREDTIALHKAEIGPHERSFVPDLFKYGVRFKPDPSERNIYRTILVQGLSSDTTMRQILQNIRGGEVVDAKLLETCKLTGSNSALIVFLHEHAAMAYEEYARNNPLTINNQPVSAKVVNSPTYPTRTGLKKAIEDLQHTRCLEIHNFPRQVSESQLRLDLRVSAHMHGDRVEHLKMRKDGILELHYSSIAYAGQGFGMFTTYRLYKGSKACFVLDPCAQPLATLLQKSTGETDVKAASSEPEVNAAGVELESNAVDEFDRLSSIQWES